MKYELDSVADYYFKSMFWSLAVGICIIVVFVLCII